jgi:MFS family permease
MLGQAGRADRLRHRGRPVAYMLVLSSLDFLDWGWRFPFYVAFAINVVALFARLRLVTTHEYSHLLDEHQLDPVPVGELMSSQSRNVIIGALAVAQLCAVPPGDRVPAVVDHPHLAAFAGGLPASADGGRGRWAIGIIISGYVADRVGRRRTLGTLATMIGIFSLFVPFLINGGETVPTFILIGFSLLGLSYGQLRAR